jgi:transposase
LDEKGGVAFEGKTAVDPSVLADLIRSKAPDVARVGLETGATTPRLFHALTAAGLPVICMDARHANAALSMRPRKSDRSDARGLADILRMGRYREVRAKSIAAHERRALLATRHHLVTIRTELDAQMRGTADQRTALLAAESLGDETCEAHWRQKGARRRCAQDRGHPAMHLD